MAVKFLSGLDVKGVLDARSNINLNKSELQNAVIQNLATAPGAPLAGQIYFNTTSDKLEFYDGAAWQALPDGNTTANDFLTALSFNTGTGVLTGTVSNQANPTVDLDGRYALSSSIPTVNNGTLTMSTSTGLDGSATFTANQAGNSTFTVALDLSELADMTQTMLNTDEFIVLDSGVQKRKQASEIGNSIFSNTVGYITAASLPSVSNATITISAGTNLTGGGAFSLNQASAETIIVNMETGGVGAGNYGSTSNSVKIDNISVDAYGRVTAVTTGATGQVNSVVSGNTSTLSHSGTIDKVLTPVTAAVSNGGASLATGDQIYDFVAGQIANIPSGLSFEGNWNASTDSPDLSGATPDNGQFWIVSVAGSTDLDGITDWEVGDWAIYVSTGAGTDGWQKVDNSSTLSGFGAPGRVTFWSTTANVTSDAGFTYDASTNAFAVGGAITAGGIMTASGGNSSQWNTGYARSLTALNVTGSGTKTLTATKQDGTTLTTSWTDNDTQYSMMTASVLGLGKLEDNTTQAIAANTVSAVAGKTYGIQKNSSNQLVVNVPWTDSQNLVASVDESTANNLKGILVNPTTGNVKVGLNINGLASIGTPVGADTLPIYDAGTNKKVSVTQLATAAQDLNSYAVTISDTATITHGLSTRNVIIQLYDVTTYETVYADVVRAGDNTATITFSSTPTNSIKVMVQKVIE